MALNRGYTVYENNLMNVSLFQQQSINLGTPTFFFTHVVPFEHNKKRFAESRFSEGRFKSKHQMEIAQNLGNVDVQVVAVSHALLPLTDDVVLTFFIGWVASVNPTGRFFAQGKNDVEECGIVVSEDKNLLFFLAQIISIF